MSHYTGSVPTTQRATDWRVRAACLGRWNEMHPDNNEHEIENAKQICRQCPVQVPCVLDALRTGDIEHGIRGAMKPSERRNMARQMAARQRAEREASGDEPAPKKPKRTFLSLWNQHSRPLPDGHAGWEGPTPISLQGRYYTPTQIAFRVDRKRPPTGIVRRTCPVDGCVLPAHLTDQAERDAARGKAAA
jgi:WhiB family redox-sensing transcriptional regulator